MALWVIVPAAGSGSRMQREVPKQYLHIEGRPVLVWTLQRLLQLDGLRETVLVISPGDHHWSALAESTPELAGRVRVCEGGAERSLSVLRGLEALSGQAAEEDWVLVHDAARPCVRVADIMRLLHGVAQHPAGGLLAVPVADTLKRSTERNAVAETVDRSGLWAAQTPQLFRYGVLREALQSAVGSGHSVTDEASALEARGHTPLLVMGNRDNIKITWPQDLYLASLVLQAQQMESAPRPE